MKKRKKPIQITQGQKPTKHSYLGPCNVTSVQYILELFLFNCCLHHPAFHFHQDIIILCGHLSNLDLLNTLPIFGQIPHYKSFYSKRAAGMTQFSSSLLLRKAVMRTCDLGLHQAHSHPGESDQEENRGGSRLYTEFLVVSVVGLFLCAIPGDFKTAQSHLPEGL